MRRSVPRCRRSCRVSRRSSSARIARAKRRSNPHRGCAHCAWRLPRRSLRNDAAAAPGRTRCRGGRVAAAASSRGQPRWRVRSCRSTCRSRRHRRAASLFASQCGTCHTVEHGAPPRQGPNLAGVSTCARPARCRASTIRPGSHGPPSSGTTTHLDAWLDQSAEADPRRGDAVPSGRSGDSRAASSHG